MPKRPHSPTLTWMAFAAGSRRLCLAAVLLLTLSAEDSFLSFLLPSLSTTGPGDAFPSSSSLLNRILWSHDRRGGFIVGANAYREYLKYLPNAERVTCPSDADCWSGPCGAFGHPDCRTGDTNSFGDAFKDEDGDERGMSVFGELRPSGPVDKGWSTELCLQDSDGDGKTNGDELGDPCCLWNMGQTPEYVTDITSPGHGTSATTRASCRFQPPTAPLLSVDGIGSSSVQLSWSLPSPLEACICLFNISVTYLATGETFLVTSLPKFQGNEAVISDLRPGEQVIVKVMALNHMSPKSPRFSSVNAVASTGTVSLGLQATALDAVPTTLPQPLSFAGTVSEASVYPTLDKLNKASIALAILLVLLGILGPLVLHQIKNPSNRIRHWLYHSLVIPAPPPIASSFVSSLLLTPVDVLWQLSWGSFLLLLLFIATLVVWFLWQWESFRRIPHPYGAAVPWARALGYVAFLPLALLALPAPRLGIFLRFLGLGRDRALLFHRLLGTSAILLSSVHGIALLIAYLVDSFPGGAVLVSTRALELNGLAGTLLLICFGILGAGAIPWVRRRFYTAFLYTHMLAFPALLLSVLHVTTEYPLLVMLAVPAAIWAIDCLVYLRQYWSSAHVHEANIIDRNHCELVVKDVDPKEIQLVRRRPHGGDFVNIAVPSITPISHPLSVASFSLTACNKQLLRPSSHAVSSSEDYTAVNTPKTATTAADTSHPATEPSLGSGSLPREAGTGSADTLSSDCVRLIFKHSERPGSWTWRLHQQIAEGAIKPGTAVRLMGPMGSTSLYGDPYGLLMLVAGGVGITPMMSILSEAHKKRQSGGLKQEVRLLWSCRSMRLVYEVLQRLREEDVLLNSQTRIMIFLSQPSENGSSELFALQKLVDHLNDMSDTALGNRKAIQVFRRRPALENDAIAAVTQYMEGVEEEQTIQKADILRRCIGVSVCGPASLIFAARSTSQQLQKSHPSYWIHFEEHTFDF